MNAFYKKIGTIIVLFSLLITACKSNQKVTKVASKKEVPCCIGNYKDYEFVPLIELGAEFRRLKKDLCCNKKNSALYKLMKQLGKQLGKPGTPKEKILEVMGKADLEKNSFLRYYLGTKKEGMFFELKDHKVVNYRWVSIS